MIPVSRPKLAGNESRYVLDCIESSWISSIGEYISRFEQEFAAFVRCRHAIAVSNGTTALHLSLLAFDIGPGDEIIVPSLTYIASVNAIAYCGATPVFADSDELTGNIDPVSAAACITPKTKGIIAVHLYGHPADMDPLLELARRHNLFVIEDAAEAHGAEYKGRRTGSLGDIGVFSFYGNKLITTGEGGMLTTDDAALAAKIRLLKSQGMDPARRFWHPVIGYNYRMTNIQAAIGLAQLERAEEHIKNHLAVARLYDIALAEIPGIQLPVEQPWAKHVCWLYTIQLAAGLPPRDVVMERLAATGIETRPVFYPAHQMPPYQYLQNKNLPTAERLSRQGLNLPTYDGLTEEEIAAVAAALRLALVETS